MSLFAHLIFFFLPFSVSSCGGGKSYGVVYFFWFGVGSHMSLADFYTSMIVPWLGKHYHVHMCVFKAVQTNATAALLALRTENLCVCILWVRLCKCLTASVCPRHNPYCSSQHTASSLPFPSLFFSSPHLSVLFMILLIRRKTEENHDDLVQIDSSADDLREWMSGLKIRRGLRNKKLLSDWDWEL